MVGGIQMGRGTYREGNKWREVQMGKVHMSWGVQMGRRYILCRAYLH